MNYLIGGNSWFDSDYFGLIGVLLLNSIFLCLFSGMNDSANPS
ncbi:MAG: hypothetical protein ACI85I_000061 [Arenicella sp.]|jgi:hypothetical protein